jgi:hypothetical protein
MPAARCNERMGILIEQYGGYAGWIDVGIFIKEQKWKKGVPLSSTR